MYERSLPTNATAKGGTVISWAWFAVKPSPATMDGAKLCGNVRDREAQYGVRTHYTRPSRVAPARRPVNICQCETDAPSTHR